MKETQKEQTFMQNYINHGLGRGGGAKIRDTLEIFMFRRAHKRSTKPPLK